MKREILSNAIINAGITATYIILVSFFIFNLENIFGSFEEDTVLAPIIMLLTFVVSAAITGLSVFGRSVMWYLDGKKKEAISLLILTIVFLVVITLLIISIVL